MARAAAVCIVNPPAPENALMKTTPLLLSVLALTAFAEDAKPAAPAPAAPAAAKAAEAPKTVQVETLTSDGKTFVLVKVIGDAQAFASFQNDVQTISQEQQQVAQVKQLAELALTTPEREARIRELETKFNRLKSDNETMAKTYGFDLTRQYVIVPTKVVVLTALTNEDYIKLAASAGFKAESVLNAGDKKFLIKETVTGAAEVEAFKLQVQRILEAKRGLQQLIDAQPRFTKDEDKKKIEEAIAKTKADVDAASGEFKKSHGYDIPNEFNLQTAEAKLYTLLSDDEKKNLDKAAEPKKDGEAKKDAPAAK